jgi:hypothetical protein
MMVPHGTFKDLRGDSVQWNGFIGILVRLFEVAEQHFGKHATCNGQLQLVALEVLISLTPDLRFIHGMLFIIPHLLFARLAGSFKCAIVEISLLKHSHQISTQVCRPIPLSLPFVARHFFDFK